MTPAAEFNIWVDPEAARIVFHSGLRIEPARGAYFEQTGEDGISLPDPVAMCVALDPSIGILSSEHYVEVEITSELTRGMTVTDRLNVAGNNYNRPVWAALLDKPPNAKIWWTIDSERWKEVLYRALR